MKSIRFEHTRVRASISLMLILTAALSACKKAEAPKQTIPPAPVVLEKAAAKDSFRFIDTLGTTSALKSVTIVPQVSGQLMTINFSQGEILKEGDIIATIDKRPYEAKVLAAKADLMQAQAKLKIDSLAVERNKKLAEKNYVDKQTYDSLVATVDADKGAVEAAKASLEIAKINLDWCTIKAPIAGKVGLYNMDAGDFATAGVSTITTIEQLDTLYVDFFVPTNQLNEIKSLMKERGGKLDIDVAYLESGFTNNARKAAVSIIENKSRYQSATSVLRGELENKDGLFASPQSVKVRLHMAEVKNGVFISDAAIQTDVMGSYVYVADKYDDILYKARKVYVNPVQQYPDHSYLVSPVEVGGKKYEVKGGEMVIKIGQLRVAEGALAYAAIPQGAPIGADGKPITKPDDIKKFMQDAITAKAKYEAEAAARNGNNHAPATQKSEGDK